jgi:hypothetical protein
MSWPWYAGSAPVVQELGPYSFQERSKKYNITFSEGGNLVSYVTLYQYELKGDKGALDDMVG